MEPQDQTAVVGSRVTLPCRVMGKIGALQWTKDDFGLGQHRNLSGFERYSMVGSDEEGTRVLSILFISDHLNYTKLLEYKGNYNVGFFQAISLWTFIQLCWMTMQNISVKSVLAL